MLVASNSVPAKTTAELIALAKASLVNLHTARTAPGSNNHLASELLNSMAGIQTDHIPYRGSAPLLTDLIGGRIHFAL